LIPVELLITIVYGIEIGPIKPSHNRVVKFWEQLVQSKRQVPSGTQQIER